MVSEQPNNQQIPRGDLPEEGMAIVPAGQAPQRTVSQAFGICWCAIGGATMAFGAIIPCFFVGFGVFAASWGRDRKTYGVCFATVLAAVCAACLLAYGGIDFPSVVQCIASFAIARLVVEDRVSVTTESVVILAAFAGLLASDVIGAQLAGTTIQAAMAETFDGVAQQLQADAAAMSAERIASVKDLFMSMWPMSYVLAAAVTVFVAHAGARLLAMGLRVPRKRGFAITRFDAPLWAVGLLVAGIVLVALKWLVPQAPEVLLVVGACAMMCARFYFLMQGIGVLTHLLNRVRAGSIMRFFLLVVAFDLEVSFFVMSIWGLIDVWANFRRLDRDGAVAEESPTLTS